MISITTKNIQWDESIIGYITECDDEFVTINELDEFGILGLKTKLCFVEWITKEDKKI